MDSSAWVGLLNLVLAVSSLLAWYRFWTLRHHPLVRPRFPVVSTVSIVTALLARVLVACERIALRSPCWLSVLNIPLGMIVPIYIYTLRAFVLWFSFELVHQRIQYSCKSYQNTQGWFMRHQDLISRRRIYPVVLVVYVIITALAVYNAYSYASTDDWYSDGQDSCAFILTLPGMWAIGLLNIPFAIFFSFKLRGEYDSFGIKQELKIVALTGSSIIIFSFAVQLGGFVTPQTNWYAYSAIDGAATICLSITPCFILYKISGSHFQRLPKSPLSKSKLSSFFKSEGLPLLNTILRTEKCYLALFDYCTYEFSVENLLALEKINEMEMRIEEDASELLSDACKENLESFWKDFVSIDGPLMVNIPSTKSLVIRDYVRMLDQDLSSKQVLDILLSVKEELLHLLSRDTLPRFLHTEEGKACMKMLQGMEAVLLDVDELGVGVSENEGVSISRSIR